jgi:DNA polymerase-3 subunit epsilon
MKQLKNFIWPGKYTLVDVEIPNIKNDSICAISMIVIEDGMEIVRHTELINPRSFFSGINVSIHHITQQDVVDKRTFLEFWHQYGRYFSSDYILIGHNVPSDITVMERDLNRSGIFLNPGFFIDTMDLVLNEFYHGQIEKGDMKLNKICQNMSIPIDHHNPESDVNACLEILFYLKKHGFTDLKSYIREVKLKQKESGRNEYPTVRRITEKKYDKDIRSRKFRPYFGSFTNRKLTFQPYFDRVTLADLKNTCLIDTSALQIEAIDDERAEIKAFIDSIGGTIYDESQILQASCYIEFLVPKPESFLHYKRKGIKLFHSLDVLRYIEKYETQKEKDAESLQRILEETKGALRTHSEKEKEISTETANEKGREAYLRKDLARTIYYYELSVKRGSGNLRVYRHLADLYHRHGLYEEEERVLKKGIKVGRRKKKNIKNLQAKLGRLQIRKEEMSDADKTN